MDDSNQERERKRRKKSPLKTTSKTFLKKSERSTESKRAKQGREEGDY